uniref:Protein quiver n=1 Tax=Panagrellus redivivus TaxID=6233 RepID=A0A7E5A065_PANRE
MSALTIIFTVCAVLCILAPGAFSIECYTSATEHEDGCEYCLYSNTTISGLGHHKSLILYMCLTQLFYAGEQLDPSVVNRCVDVKKNELLGSGDEQLYVCDKDLCNAHCDGTRVGFGIAMIVAVISAIVRF